MSRLVLMTEFTTTGPRTFPPPPVYTPPPEPATLKIGASVRVRDINSEAHKWRNGRKHVVKKFNNKNNSYKVVIRNDALPLKKVKDVKKEIWLSKSKLTIVREVRLPSPPANMRIFIGNEKSELRVKMSILDTNCKSKYKSINLMFDGMGYPSQIAKTHFSDEYWEKFVPIGNKYGDVFCAVTLELYDKDKRPLVINFYPVKVCGKKVNSVTGDVDNIDGTGRKDSFMGPDPIIHIFQNIRPKKKKKNINFYSNYHSNQPIHVLWNRVVTKDAFFQQVGLKKDKKVVDHA